MSRLLYYLVLKPLSYLPLSFLYFISELIYFFVYHVVGYRKSVVYDNLKNSFPNKTKDEIEAIQREFYIHLCDLIVENIRLFSMPLKEVKKRFKIVNTEILDDFYNQGRSIILVGGHYNNYELTGMAIDVYTRHQVIGIVAPLSNKFFNNKFSKSRSKYGVQLLSKGLVPRSFISNKNKLTMTVFGADQSPTYSNQLYWTTFLNQETAVHAGPEVFAVKYNYPVLYIKVNKVKRGYYEGVFEVIEENPAGAIKGKITELHTKILEKMIIDKPQYWLWSHKRWKRKKTEEERAAEIKETVKAA